jgi:hypothetical protein
MDGGRVGCNDAEAGGWRWGPSAHRYAIDNLRKPFAISIPRYKHYKIVMSPSMCAGELVKAALVM